jgi:flagellar basal body-associated protein FliL
MSSSKKTLITIIIVVVIALLGFFAWQYVSLSQQLKTAQKTISTQQVNAKVLAFSKLFVANVLQGGQSVSFDQRLQLENAVRDINDPQIYSAWQKFTNAKDQAEIQKDFYGLFSLLLDKLGS